MAEKYSYRNLIVWQRAQELALEGMQLVQLVPQSWANAVIVRQIVSSATSIGANIAEGHGRFTPAAHRNHLSIAKGSAAETDSWLDLMRRSGWLSADKEAVLHRECSELMAMLTSKINSLDRMESNSSKLRESEAMYGSDEGRPCFPFAEGDYAVRVVPGF